jgi:predicted metal-dependent HD superfamily phosphohydrolase
LDRSANIFLSHPVILRKAAILRGSPSNEMTRMRVPPEVRLSNMNYRAAKQYILNRLRTELSVQLYYHGLHHTLDVLKMATKIALDEGVRGRDLKLVKTASLFHDCGFVKNKHAGHEAEGCLIVREHLPPLGYTDADIEKICGMIMATKIPQSPNNLLEEIICDADLDYLGRPDFYPIGNTLFQEMQNYHLIGNETDWNKLQVSFLSVHRFYTRTNKTRRDPVKQQYLAQLKVVVAAY